MSDAWVAACIAIAVGLVVLAGAVVDVQRRLLRLPAQGPPRWSPPFPPSGTGELPVGGEVPTFVLRNTSGHMVKSRELWRPGPVLLLIMTPGCGACDTLLKELIANGWPSATPIATILPTPPGSAPELASRVRVFHQDQQQPATLALRPKGTPYAVLVDGQGMVQARGLVGTLEQLLSMASTIAGSNTDHKRRPLISKSAGMLSLRR